MTSGEYIAVAGPVGFASQGSELDVGGHSAWIAELSPR